MSCEEHLDRDLLKRFLDGIVTSQERKHVVRHLLQACEPCRRLTYQMWFPDRSALSPERADLERESESPV